MAQPHPDYSDFARAFEELTTRSVADQVLVAQRLRDLLQQVAAGEVDLVTLRSQYDRLVTEQAAQLTRDLTTLGVRYYETMLDLNRAYAERLFDDLGAAAGLHNSNNARQAPPAEPPPAPAVVELRLRGKAGDWIEDGFVVENKRSEPSQIAFLLSEFTGDGVEPFRPAVKLEPPRLELDPHEEATVMLRLELDRESFKPGVQYHAQLLVRGTDELELRLVVDVDEPAPLPKAAPKPRNTTRKKRAAS
jgi:hypothetical protein